MKVIPPSKAVLDLLEFSEVARNDYKKGYIELLKNDYCLNESEKAVIERILTQAPSQASFQRECAYAQNTMWLFPACDVVKKKRQKHCRKVSNEIVQEKAKLFSFRNLFK